MHVVIGAGPAGLVTAWRLQREGHEVRVLEAADHVGGVAGSREVAGIHVDLGRRRLDPATPPWLLEELGQIVELQEHTVDDRVRVGGRWVPFPPTPVGLLRARRAPVVGRHVHDPCARKLFDTDPDELVGRQDPSSSPLDVARRSVRSLWSKPTYLHPRRGFGAIAEALAERLPVDTGRRVNRIIEHHDRVIVGLSDGRLVTASHVHASVPAWRVASWLGLHEDPLGPPRVRAVVLVYLVLDRSPYTTFDAHHLPDPQVLPMRVSEPTNHRDSAEDPTDRTVLCAEIPCWPDDETWTATPEALGARVADDLIRSGLPDPRHVAVHVERLPSAHVVPTTRSLAARARAERALTLSERVTVLGPESPTYVAED